MSVLIATNKPFLKTSFRGTSFLFSSSTADLFTSSTDEKLEKQKEFAVALSKGEDLEIMELTREDLIKDASNDPEFELPYLHLITSTVIIEKVPAYFLFSAKGVVELLILHPKVAESQFTSLVEFLDSGNWLIVNFGKIISEFYEAEEFTGSTYYNLTPLTRQEKEIIKIIRSGGINNINITFRNGEEFFVEILRKKPAKKVIEQIEGIIAKNKYVRITLETENGIVTYINEIEKKIIK